MAVGSWGYDTYCIVSKEDERRVLIQIDTKDDLNIGNHYCTKVRTTVALALSSKETPESTLETYFRLIIA